MSRHFIRYEVEQNSRIYEKGVVIKMIMKLKSNTAVKVTAVILLFLTCAGTFLSAFLCFIMTYFNSYLDGGLELKSTALHMLISRNYYTMDEYLEAVYSGNEEVKDYYFREILNPNKTNLRFYISDGENNYIASNADKDSFTELDTFSRTFKEYIDETEIYVEKTFGTSIEAYSFINEYKNREGFEVTDYYIESEESEENGVFTARVYGCDVKKTKLCVSLGIDSELPAKDIFYFADSAIERAVTLRYSLIWSAVIFAFLSTVIFVFIMCTAGHKTGKDGIYIGYLDRIPFDILTGVLVLLAILPAVIIYSVYDTGVSVFIFCVSLIFWFLILLEFFWTLAVRVKSRNVFKNTVIYMCLRLAYRFLKKLAGLIGFTFRNLPVCWKAVLIYGALTIFELLVMSSGSMIGLFILIKIMIFAAIVYVSSALKRLQRGGEELASGNAAYIVDTRRMPRILAAHARNLNNISKGLRHAVDEQTKSERMKAELVTNVSHDIKTPLTSIVNYVDILKREGLNSARAPEYLEILAKQSARLKKLTEDLIELSKASTGNISANIENTNLGVLLSQAMGEYEEKFNARKLEIILKLSDENSYVMADGQLLWRVIDNLMNNINKYALEGTRVYISALSKDNLTDITFRNISANAIDVPENELTERFVRGDLSRTTEGSGLGLSIAKNLTEIQGGRFRINTDADLFKVTLTFASGKSEVQDIVENPQPESRSFRTDQTVQIYDSGNEAEEHRNS